MPKNIRLPRAVCSVVASILHGSHTTLDALFVNSGAPLPPPGLSHATKWKEWLFLCGTNPECDTLAVLGNVLEEFMDTEPCNPDEVELWKEQRERVVRVLEENGFRCYRGGRVLPSGAPPPAMHPLTHRRKGAIALTFSTEYGVQDLLHALLRPWVADIRPEEFTPSYAGSNTRMDFLLSAHGTVIELKFARDANHAKKIGEELIVDIEHYRSHPKCDTLWCVVFDPEHLIRNVEGLRKDLEGARSSKDGTVQVKILVLT